eukprot:Tamp_18282.p1 GENE.Tamp_18282~~Tamp_18282.p1  ORF type:complete len:337 (+),score=85.60 Tamp_18282:36-1013(+)
MRSGYWLLLAVGLAFLVFRGDAAFLQADVGSEYLCKPEAEISHLDTLQPEEKKRCLEYCNRIKADVEDMEEADKDKKEADKKRCKDTANALAKLPAAMQQNLGLVETLVADIHNGACLATLMADWAARDAACSSEQDDAAQRMKVFQRMVTVLVQFYGKPDKARRASSGEKPPTKDFCAYQVAEWMQNGGILFDSEKCANMHPMYNDMKDCKKECWTFMKEKMGGTGCISLYYEIMFDTIGSTRTADPDPTNDMLTKPEIPATLESTADKECTDTPCTSMMDTVKACAKVGGEKDWIKYSPKAFSQDWRGTVQGGVYCWQGMNCH